MKEMPIFEDVFNRLIRLPRFGVKFLIGGLLSFVPIVNILAFGYLYRMSRAVRNSGQPVLPAWHDWSGLFLDGLRFTIVWLFYWLVPISLAFLISLLMPFVYLGALSSIFFLTSVLLSTLLFSSALYRYNMQKSFKDLLDLMLIIRMTGMGMPRLILPGFVFLGFIVLLQPFYGFAIFGGFLLLITFTSLRYRSIESNPSVFF